MTCIQAVADALIAEGTEVVFGLMGDANMALVVDLVDRCGVRFVSVRHEATAVLAADGYARSSGRPGVATVTQGPGLANTATALTVSRHAAAPVVLLAGASATADLLNVQRFDQATFASATAGAFASITTPGVLNQQLRTAFLAARTGRGPTVVDLPVDIGALPRPPEPYASSQGFLPTEQRRAPDVDQLQALAKLLGEAQHPVLLAGRGALGAREALLALAERVGALLVTSLPAKGLFDGEPYAVGVCGGVALPFTRELLGEADLVLGFGAGLNRFTLDAGRLAPAAAVALVTDSATSAPRNHPLDQLLLADAELAAAGLADLVAQSTGWRTGDTQARIGRAQAQTYQPQSHPDGLDPRAVIDICNRALPAERSAVVGIGHFGGWPAQYLDVPVPGALHLPWEFGSIGVGVPVGIGVAAARPDHTTVVFEGDGSLLTCLGELDTAARAGLPLLVVVFDDSAYGAEIRKLDLAGMPTDLALFARRDLAAAARALGCDAVAVTDVEDLEVTLGALGRPERPTLVQVPITRRMRQSVF